MKRSSVLASLGIAVGLLCWGAIAFMRVRFPISAEVDKTYFVDQGAWLYSGLCGVLAGVSVTALVLIFQSTRIPEDDPRPWRDYAARLLVGAFLAFVFGAILWASVASHKEGQEPNALIGYSLSIPAIATLGIASLQLVSALFWVVSSLSGSAGLSSELTTMLRRSGVLVFAFFLFQSGLSLGDLLFRFGFSNRSAYLLTAGLVCIGLSALGLARSAPSVAAVSDRIRRAEKQLVTSYGVSVIYTGIAARSSILFANSRLPDATVTERSAVLVGAFLCTAVGVVPAFSFLCSMKSSADLHESK